MRKFMSRAIEVVLLASLLALVSAIPASANGTTPTPTPTGSMPACTITPPPAAPPCTSARVTLTWLAKHPTMIRVALSATHCPAPAACAGAPAFSAVTTAPLEFEIFDSACNDFSTVFTQSALNTTGCPGKDFYKNLTQKVRLIYGASTTAIGFMEVPASETGTLPAITPPLTYSIRDSKNYAIQGTLSTCIVKQTSAMLRMKCF
jgi:hypothetical protein